MAAAVASAPVRNYWTDARCAKAFWGQHELPPYRQLLSDTLDWCAPRSGERWLDLGCGGGALSRGLWERSGGGIAEVLGVDCAAENEVAYQGLRDALAPSPGNRVRFACGNFSAGLPNHPTGSFDGVVSGLSISYAEEFDAQAGRWTSAGYDRVLTEVRRTLRPGGRFVFSVNVPNPSWGKVGLRSLGAAVRSARPLRFLRKSWRMLRYGRWLKAEARTGRFHYFEASEVATRLRRAGFEAVEHRLSYVGQAYVFRARAGA